MPPKRRASSSTEESVPSAKKVKKTKGAVNYNQSAICQELFDTVRNHKLADGRLLCETLIRVPKRRTTPEYYDTIKSPIDLLKIQQKLKTDEYEEIEKLTEDIQLLVKNAKTYYQRSSQQHQDAIQLWTLYNSTKSELIAAAFGESSPQKTVNPAIQAKCRQLLDAFKKLKNGDRLLCEVFMTLPEKKALPIYYQTIKHPIDLDTISKKLSNGAYDAISFLEQDLNLMLKNAMDFNEPGSTIYKDAETLKLMMSAVMSDIMLASPNISKSDKRSRRSSTAAADPMDEDTDTDADAARSYDDADDGDEDTSMLSLGDDDLTSGDPYWLLFKSIATHTDDQGRSAAKPFLVLPNKRWFPDYYDDIANPISMSQIKQKIKRKKYNSLNEMATDLNLMFENAKEYNADESKIFQNAIEMQSVMWEKKKLIEAGVKSEPEGEVFTEASNHLNRSEEVEPLTPAVKGSATRGRGGGRPRGGKGGRTPGATPDDVSVPSTSASKRGKGRGRGRLMVMGGNERSLKKRLLAIYTAVYDCEDKEGRSLVGEFVELPSRVKYPEYYDYITEPIDMTLIEEKINSDRYGSEKELIMDLKLMFNNARSFNEDSSRIYKDAGTLEKAMKKKVMAMSIADDPVEDFSRRTFATLMSSLPDKLNDLYETIKVFKDQHNRVLSTPFVRLPAKSDYAEYYEVIKKPMDLARILQKIQAGNYESLESLLLDVTQMFDNAMTFNEPQSVLYKDSAVLLNEFLKRYECLDDHGQYKAPDIPNEVQKMINTLYQAAVNHTDEDGRCYADSINELTRQMLYGPSFVTIGLNLKHKRYKRLDTFQDDIFAVCENVRKASRTDSQAFEDSIEIQKMFITARDNICRNGEGSGFCSPAISYTHRHLLKAVEELTAQKTPNETDNGADDTSKRKVPDKFKSEEEVTKGGVKYENGDFVYITAKENPLQPHIVNIEKMWKDSNDVQWLYGGWFYRPSETTHTDIRKFMNQELFRTDVYDSIPFSAVTGKCYVMCIKEYFRNSPQGFADNDVYVCESTYNKKSASFCKIKSFSSVVTVNRNINVVPRAIPLLLTRLPSTCATVTGTVGDKPVATPNKPIVKERKSVTIKGNNGDADNPQYEQYVAENGLSYKLGDFVYVGPSTISHKPNQASTGLPPIARIEKLYKDARGWLVFTGPLFLRPESIEHTPARLFYRKEVFLSAAEDKTYNLASVIGKCSVLYCKDYCNYRLTRYSEDHVYVCESKYIEGGGENSTKRISKWLKGPQVSTAVCNDEIFYFSKKISIKRVASPMLFKLCAESYIQDQDDEDSRSQTMTPVAPSTFDPFVTNETSRSATSPGADKLGKKKRKKYHITSFQLFANDIRRSIQDENPGSTFGEVSQLIAAKWRSLPDSEIQRYKDTALKLQNESKAKEAAAAKEAAKNPPPPTQFNKEMFHSAAAFSQSGQHTLLPQPQHFTPQQTQYQQQLPPHQQQVMMQGGMMHGTPMNMQQGFMPHRPMMTPDGQQWQGMPQGVQPGPPQQMFPGHSPMMPHANVQQFHMQQNMTGSPMHRPSPAQTPDQNMPQQMHQQPIQVFQMTPVSQQPAVSSQQVMASAPPPVQRPPSPKFVSVDLPPQKLAHSDVYLKYIGGLRGDNPVKISNWERELNTEMPTATPSRVPAHWLANGAGAHGNILTALHSLRDLMVKDSLKLQRAYQL